MNTIPEHDDRYEPASAAQTLVELPPQQSLRNRYLLSVVMGVGIFAAGSIFGVAITRYRMDAQSLTDPIEAPAKIADRLQFRLALSHEQRDEIETIIRAHQPRFRAIRARVTPEVRSELQVIMKDISGVLNDQQRARWQPTAEQRLGTFFPEKVGE
jgi:uncharacterized membrane protein